MPAQTGDPVEPTRPAAGGAPGRSETAHQRLDRNWSELLQELRVAQTGGQILTGFLLTVPFQQGFTRLDPAQRRLYLALVLLAIAATGLLIAPVGIHRILFRHGRKAALVRLADRLTQAGLACLASTLSGVCLLIWDVVEGPGPALAVGALALVALATCWFLLPLVLLRRHTTPEA